MDKIFKVDPNFTPPAEKSNAIRKCPYRKIYTVTEDKMWSTKTIKEEFQDCIGSECARWSSPFGCK